MHGAEVYPGWRLFLDASGAYRGSSADSERSKGSTLGGLSFLAALDGLY